MCMSGDRVTDSSVACRTSTECARFVSTGNQARYDFCDFFIFIFCPPDNNLKSSKYGNTKGYSLVLLNEKTRLFSIFRFLSLKHFGLCR